MANNYTDLQEQLRQDALAAAAAGSGQEKPVYAGTYEDQLAQIFDKIQNREPFQYDVNADPLYQQYKDQYIQGGKLAMKDTMGQAAALTGGYGSTYGQQVGQQSYDAYLQNLSAVIPELYGMAYDMYRDKGDDLTKQYGMLGDLRDTEYNRYRDQMSDWNYQQEVARQLEDTEYRRRIEAEDTEYNRRMNEENTAFSRQQTAYSNLVALIRASGYNPTDAELQAAGLTREAANALQQEYIRSITPVVAASSGGGGGGGGRSSGGSSGSSQKSTGAVSDALKTGSGAVASAVAGITGALSSFFGGNGSGADTSGDRQITITDPRAVPEQQGQQVTVNRYGEVRNGNNMTRGEIAREAQRAYSAGEISYSEYQTLMRSVH